MRKQPCAHPALPGDVQTPAAPVLVCTALLPSTEDNKNVHNCPKMQCWLLWEGPAVPGLAQNFAARSCTCDAPFPMEMDDAY